MKKHRTIWLIILITSSLNVNSQVNNNFFNRTPDFIKITTPNAASFDKFIDNPVSLYNGSVDVSIPVYTLKDGNIELPFTLRYNTSGIKVSEEASWVGLGWNLNVGGVITQNVVGDYDDMDLNYNTILCKLGITNVYNPYYVPQYSNDWIRSFDLYAGSGNIGRSGKLNPDVFYYSYPGGNGKFIFDYRNDSIYILGRESAEKIEVLVRNNTSTPSLQEFKITTNAGTQHYFRYFTRIYSNDLLRTSSVSYVLYKSIYSNNQQVDYTYGNRAIRKINRSNIFQANLSTIEDGCDLIGYPVLSPTEDALEGEEFYLSNIRTTNYQINFETSERSDLMNGLKLDKIKIYPKNNISDATKIKEFVFDYDYFISDRNTIGWKPESWNAVGTGMIYTESQNLQRLKLLAVYEQSGTNKTNKYNFTYNSGNLPAKTSYAVDYWGNYNGQNGSSYLPDLKRLLWGEIITNNERSKIISEKYTADVSYVNRGYDDYYCKIGALTKITYPTGGTKEIIYEPNTFTYPTELPTAREYINTITMSNYSVLLTDYNQVSGGKTETFTLTENRSGKLDIILSRGQHTGSYQDGYYWWNLKGSKITIIKDGNICFDYDLTADCHNKGNCPDNSNCDNSNPGQLRIALDIPFTFTPGNYKICVNMTDNIPDQSTSSNGPAYAYLQGTLSLYPLKNIPVPLTPQTVQGCGMRVAQVINDFNDNNKTTTFYEYSDGILHDVLQYVKVYDNVYIDYSSSCGIRDGNGQILNSFIRRKSVVEVFGNNTMSNPYASTGGVGYSSVKEITKSNNINQGWIISEFNNTTPYTTQESVRVDNPLDGKLVKTSFYLNNGTVKKEVRYNYSYNIAHRYFGINFRKNINVFTNIFVTSGIKFNNPDMGDPFYASKAFSIIAHPLNANDILLNSIITTTDNVIFTESYAYNPTTLQLTSKKILKSDGDNIEYKYSYPNDYAFVPYTDMMAVHILSPVIEEKVYNNNKYIGGALTRYKTAMSGSQMIYVPDKKYFSSLSTPLSIVPVTFSSSGENTAIYPSANIKYENQTIYGKPQSITYNDVDRIIYLYSYNYQYPIAEIKNATYSDVCKQIGNGNENNGKAMLETIANKSEPSATDYSAINNLRITMLKAMVSTYTYKPLVGILTATDPGSKTIYYEYGSFNRLKCIKDQNGNLIENYDYHYQTGN